MFVDENQAISQETIDWVGDIQFDRSANSNTPKAEITANLKSHFINRYTKFENDGCMTSFKSDRKTFKQIPPRLQQLSSISSKKVLWTNIVTNNVGLDKEQRQMLAMTINKQCTPSTREDLLDLENFQRVSQRRVPESKNYHPKSGKTCYIPQKLIHTWVGHRRGVQKILWQPNHANLMLSAGLDGLIKIWDVNGERNCMHTYVGHGAGVRDIAFTNDSKTFVSSSFDKDIKIWDTETGKVKKTISHDKVSYVVKIHPDENKQTLLLVGSSDQKIYQYDINTCEIVQEYNRHLDAVNTITFINQNRWFLTTSDDKTVRLWEFGIPEQIKYVADPSMHSIPFVGTSPDNQWLLLQSMDNKIVTYGAGERIYLNKRKTFRGHSNAGYALQVGMSSDSQFVISGDGGGHCLFWDWKTTKLLGKIKAHAGVCVGATWHPHEISKVATCGWGDSVIKLWD
jgi:WD40 repeat protein